MRSSGVGSGVGRQPRLRGEAMILTWLWKMVLGFGRRRSAAPILSAPRPAALDEGLGLVNRSSDQDNSGVVIFDGESAPPVR